jgi:N-acetylmuramoyl-L-alanine amidase
MLSPLRHARFLPAACRGISAILFAVRLPLLTAILAGAIISWLSPSRVIAREEQAQTPAQIPAPPQQPPPAVPPAQPQTSPSQNPLPPPLHVGPTIVINPAHGGTDNGARGQSGQVEKDVVLIFARMLRSEFERQGYRVVMTRNDDSNPSYEDRAAVANGYRDALFVSLHISSTGKVGTARTYSYQLAAPLAPPDTAASATSAASIPQVASSRASGLIPWDQAQRSYAEASHRLADVLQAQLAQKFTGSPGVSTRVAVRELRSVAVPAVAVEASSVSSDPNTLLMMGAPLAAALVRGVQISRPLSTPPGSPSAPAGTK